MTPDRKSIHGQWSSRWAFIMAATGSAVGLGNIWRFPYITGENGGGAFVLVYLACVLFVGVPVMIAEIVLGRRGRQSPINTMRTLAVESGASPAWQSLGWMGIIAGFFILSFYSVVAGWTLAYVFRTASGMFTGNTAEAIASEFGRFVGDPERLLAWHTIFMVLTVVVVSRGVRHGLESSVRILMPLLFLLLVAMVGYAMNTGYFTEALGYLFTPDFSRLTGTAVLAALGQAFFSLSLGMGAIMIYGSYLPRQASIPRSVMTVAALDTSVAILAGLAIFPVVFAYGLQPAEGPGLVFNVLPVAFGQMPGGAFFGTLFFLLLAFAGWTSAISLLEPVVTWLVENRGMNRIKAAAGAGIVAWAVGILALLSLNIWSGHRLFDRSIFDLLEYTTTNIMLPLGGILIAVFAGWRLSRESSVEELGLGDGALYRAWRILIRYVTPVAVGLILLNMSGILG